MPSASHPILSKNFTDPCTENKFAVCLVSNTWNKVTSTVVKNCWRNMESTEIREAEDLVHLATSRQNQTLERHFTMHVREMFCKVNSEQVPNADEFKSCLTENSNSCLNMRHF